MPATMKPATSRREIHERLSAFVALSVLPGLLAADEPGALADHLGDVILSTLHLDLAYACVRDTAGGVYEATRTVPLPADAPCAEQELFSRRMRRLLEQSHDCRDRAVHYNGVRLHVSMRSVGLHAEWGLIGGASRRPGFPTDLEAMTLQILSNYTWALVQEQHRRSADGPLKTSPVRRSPQGLFHRVAPERTWRFGPIVPARNRTRRDAMTPEELKTHLKRLGLSQQKLARSISVSVGTVKKWVQGKARISGPAAFLIRLMAEQHEHADTGSRPWAE
jgi:hypothetical protein